MEDNPRFDSRKFCDAVIVSLKEIMGDFELNEEWMQEQENRQEFDTGTMTSDT